MSVNTPHDRLFQFAFDDLEVAAGEFGAVLPPDIRKQLDLDGLQVERTQFVEEDLSARFCDVLYRVPVRSGGEAFIWVLLEHQSRNDGFMSLRLLEYMVRAWAKLRRTAEPPPAKLPMILPIVLQHDPAGWRAPRTFRELYAGPEGLVDSLKTLVPDFTYILDDLSVLDEGDLAERSESPFLRLVLWSLRSRGDVNPTQKPLWEAAFRALWRSGKHSAALAIVRYHVEVSEEASPVALKAAEAADPDLERSCMTLYERLQQEGESRGRLKGEGEALLKLVTLKFGAPSAETENRVRSATKAELDTWVERILTATSLAELFAD